MFVIKWSLQVEYMGRYLDLSWTIISINSYYPIETMTFEGNALTTR